MDTGRKLTTGEVVEMTISILSNINVPAGLIPQIGSPIVQAINNLKKVQDAWAKEAQALQAAKEQAEQEPEEQEGTGEVNPDQWEESEQTIKGGDRDEQHYHSTTEEGRGNTDHSDMAI